MSNRKRLAIALAALPVVYVGSYVALAAGGAWTWSQTGKRRPSPTALSVADVQRWQPRWARWEPFRDVYGQDTSRGNALGYVYSPLIRLDRAWLHADRELFPATRPAGE